MIWWYWALGDEAAGLRALLLVVGTQAHVHTHIGASVLAQALLTWTPQGNLKEQVKRGFGKAAGSSEDNY